MDDKRPDVVRVRFLHGWDYQAVTKCVLPLRSTSDGVINRRGVTSMQRPSLDAGMRRSCPRC